MSVVLQAKWPKFTEDGQNTEHVVSGKRGEKSQVGKKFPQKIKKLFCKFFNFSNRFSKKAISESLSNAF